MKLKTRIVALAGLLLIGIFPVRAEQAGSGVRRIDIINWTHTDYGFTDHPLIVSELQRRYIDIALDAAVATRHNPPGERFTWTVEALDPFLAWWQETTPRRRQQMLRAIDNGQIDLNIMPFNIHPGLNAAEMEQLMHWLPQEVAAKVRPTIAIQNDVNGFPRSAVMQALDQGVQYVWMGMNGHHPFPVPTLSRWEMPDGRMAWLWSGVSYWAGYDFFHDKRWRTMQREAANLLYRWPRDGEIFRSDEASVRAAHAVCLKRLAELEEKGFNLGILPVTFSNQWRCDNDGPYPSIVAFVERWNDLGLQPELYLSTATASMERLVQEAGAAADTLRGEFGDWWAFGMSAMPRETAVARRARYLLQAAESPLLGPLSARQVRDVEAIRRDLCTYYEHTFASCDSGEKIYAPQNQGTQNEAFRYAYRAYEYARWLLARRVRVRVASEPEGLLLLNTQQEPCSGWVQIEKASLRELRNARSLRDAETGERFDLLPDGKAFRFWCDSLPGHTLRRYLPESGPAENPQPDRGPEIRTDATGWPVYIRWAGMREPLFEGEAPRLYVSRFLGGGWWGATAVPGDCFSAPKGMTRRTETPYCIEFVQELSNERLNGACRRLTVFRREPRVHVTVEFDRKLHSERNPEVIYAEFPFPDDPDRTVTATNGGVPFTPYRDHVPNTCKSFFLTDSWVKFRTPDGSRIWSSVTSPVFELGERMFFRGGDIPEPEHSNRLQSMIYNNGWGVNFPVEYTGRTLCEYDIRWEAGDPDPAAVDAATDACLVSPVVVNHPALPENPLYDKWLNDNPTENTTR